VCAGCQVCSCPLLVPFVLYKPSVNKPSRSVPCACVLVSPLYYKPSVNISSDFLHVYLPHSRSTARSVAWRRLYYEGPCGMDDIADEDTHAHVSRVRDFLRGVPSPRPLALSFAPSLPRPAQPLLRAPTLPAPPRLEPHDVVRPEAPRPSTVEPPVARARALAQPQPGGGGRSDDAGSTAGKEIRCYDPARDPSLLGPEPLPEPLLAAATAAAAAAAWTPPIASAAPSTAPGFGYVGLYGSSMNGSHTIGVCRYAPCAP